MELLLVVRITRPGLFPGRLFYLRGAGCVVLYFFAFPESKVRIQTCNRCTGTNVAIYRRGGEQGTANRVLAVQGVWEVARRLGIN